MIVAKTGGIGGLRAWIGGLRACLAVWLRVLFK